MTAHVNFWRRNLPTFEFQLKTASAQLSNPAVAAVVYCQAILFLYINPTLFCAYETHQQKSDQLIDLSLFYHLNSLRCAAIEPIQVKIAETIGHFKRSVKDLSSPELKEKSLALSDKNINKLAISTFIAAKPRQCRGIDSPFCVAHQFEEYLISVEF